MSCVQTACSLKTSYNSTLAPPLGTVRLKVIEFVRVLISTGHSTIIDALVSHNMFNAILDLCFTYEWHNVMHISVMAIVEMTFSLNNSGQRGDLHLLQPVDQGGCGLLQRLLDGFQSKRNRELAVRGERSKTVDAPSAIQGGADGIMIKIAKTINRAAAADDDVAALLSIEPRWVAFVDTALTAANVLENHSVSLLMPQRLRCFLVSHSESINALLYSSYHCSLVAGVRLLPINLLASRSCVMFSHKKRRPAPWI